MVKYNPRLRAELRLRRVQFAGIAHLAERHLAKVEVASSNLVARSRTLLDSRASGYLANTPKSTQVFASVPPLQN